MSEVDNLSIGYAPYSSDFSSSGDRRRFVYYANSRAIDFEIAKPENEYDIVFVTHGADITVWSKYDKSNCSKTVRPQVGLGGTNAYKDSLFRPRFVIDMPYCY